jgi:hypothetical protein
MLVAMLFMQTKILLHQSRSRQQWIPIQAHPYPIRADHVARADLIGRAVAQQRQNLIQNFLLGLWRGPCICKHPLRHL